MDRRKLLGLGALSTAAVTAPVVATARAVIPRRIEDRMIDRASQPAEAGVVIVDATKPVSDVRRYGADPTGVADSGPAFNAAYLVATALGNTIGGVIRAPAGEYKISTPVVFSSTSVGYLLLIGDGPGTKIINNVVGNPSNPCFLVQAKAPYFLFMNFSIYGNSATGAGGNGHAIAFINPDAVGVAGITTYYPQSVKLENVIIQHHRGNGKDYTGASIGACGFYAYAVTAHNQSGCVYYDNAMGARMYLCQKMYFDGCTMDGNSSGTNGLYIDSCQGVGFTNGVLNEAGAGGATDGLLYVASNTTTSTGIVLGASRVKNGKINLGHAACVNNSISIIDNNIQQLVDDGNHAATLIVIGNGNSKVKISGNSFLFLSTIAAGVGIDIIQSSGGFSMGGLEIANNIFDAGIGAVYLAAIRLNVGTNTVQSPVIRGNVFGTLNAFSIIDAIRLSGNINNALVENNHFWPAASTTITNAINIAASTVRWTAIQGNTYDTLYGAITNHIANDGPGTSVYVNENGVFAVGDIAFQNALASNATVSTAQPINRVAPASSVTGVILQPGTFRGQFFSLVNNSRFMITFAASATSNVADGATAAIPALCARTFIWVSHTALWFRVA